MILRHAGRANDPAPRRGPNPTATIVGFCEHFMAFPPAGNGEPRALRLLIDDPASVVRHDGIRRNMNWRSDLLLLAGRRSHANSVAAVTSPMNVCGVATMVPFSPLSDSPLGRMPRTAFAALGIHPEKLFRHGQVLFHFSHTSRYARTVPRRLRWRDSLECSKNGTRRALGSFVRPDGCYYIDVTIRKLILGMILIVIQSSPNTLVLGFVTGTTGSDAVRLLTELSAWWVIVSAGLVTPPVAQIRALTLLAGGLAPIHATISRWSSEVERSLH